MVVEPDKSSTSLYRELFEKIYTKIFYAVNEIDHIIDQEMRRLQIK
jgi:hypothetical protein